MSDSARDLSRDHASVTPAVPDSNTKSTTRRTLIAAPRKPIRHPKSKIRRDMMRALKICINGSFVVPPPPPEPGQPQKAQGRPPTITHRPVAQHGPAVKGGRCQRCIDVRKGLEPTVPAIVDVVYTTVPVEYVLKRMPPPGTMRRRVVEMLVTGMTPQEVAAVENTPRQNVHSAVRHARKLGELE